MRISRTSEALEKKLEQERLLKYNLKEQKNFSGDEELLLLMQKYERLYRDGNPAISDEEWDALVAKTGYEESLDEVVSASGRKWHRMNSPLLSLKKAISFEAMQEWLDSRSMGYYILSPKLDGLTYNAVYHVNENGTANLYAVMSRGDGINGLEFSKNALLGVDVYGLPDTLDAEAVTLLNKNNMVLDGKIEIRGEAVVDRYKWAEDNNLDVNKIVPRSIAAGILNRKEPFNYEVLAEALANENPYKLVDLERKIKALNKNPNVFEVTESNESLNEDVDFGIPKNSSNKFSVKLTKNATDRQNKIFAQLRKEHIYFIAFSAASDNGNVDIVDLEIAGIKHCNHIEEFKHYTDSQATEDVITRKVNAFYSPQGDKPSMKVASRFYCDGMVIKPQDSFENSQEAEPFLKNGKLVIPKAPKDQLAVKLHSQAVDTEILEILYSSSELGNTGVKAKIKPVYVEGGIQVSTVNLHNPDWLQRPENLWIKENVKAKVALSMGAIPILIDPAIID